MCGEPYLAAGQDLRHDNQDIYTRAIQPARLQTTAVQYDGNGNLMDILPPGVVGQGPGAIRYHFSQRNLLIAQETYLEAESDWVWQAEFVYDGDGNRLRQIDHTGSQPLPTTYTNDIVGLSQVLVSDDGTTATYNLFGLDLISQDDGTETRFMLADGLGSVRTEMVSSAIQTTTTYEPYGKLLARTGDTGTVYGFTGEQYDALTGLVYLRARYYNPSLKLFMSRDPFPGYATLSISQNGYAYVHANPVNLTDPSGEIVPLIVGGLVIGAVTGITWDVMVEQGKGGVENILNGIFFDNCHWEDVNWGRAWFKGGLGGAIGMVSAPVIYLVGSYGSSAMSNAPMFAYTRGVSAAYRLGQTAPRVASILHFVGKTYGTLELGSDIYTVGKGVVSDNPQDKFDAAMALLNPATGASSAYDMYDKAELVIRQEISDFHPKYRCMQCAIEFNSTFGDDMILITSGTFGKELRGPGGIDIGAPAGWHVIAVDRYGNAWDNQGFQGTAGRYVKKLTNANDTVFHYTHTNFIQLAQGVFNFRSGN